MLHLDERGGWDNGFPSTEIEICLVVVEGKTFCAAELGQDVHDAILLGGCEFVLAMMVAVVRTFSETEVMYDATACFCLPIVWHVFIELAEAPCFLYQLHFVKAKASAALPCRRIDGRANQSIIGLQQIGLMMHALVAQRTVFVEAEFISIRNNFII